MRHPHLYRIGINCECFGIKKFLQWDIYGLWHALIIFMCCFFFLIQPGQNLTNGKDMGFWVVGHLVYGACVVVANITMIHQFNNFTGWGEALCMMMILSYFTIYFLQNLVPFFPQIYLIYDTTFIQPTVWASLIFVSL